MTAFPRPSFLFPTFSPHRDQNEVLAEDREKLRVLQPLQPWFSKEQREELAEVHPWIKQHTIPQEIDTQVLAHQKSITVNSSSPYEQMFNTLLCLSGLCELQLSCRHVPLPSPTCTWQFLTCGEPSAGRGWTCGWHLRDSEWKSPDIRFTVCHPCQEPQQLPPCISSDQSGGVDPCALV